MRTTNNTTYSNRIIVAGGGGGGGGSSGTAYTGSGGYGGGTSGQAGILGTSQTTHNGGGGTQGQFYIDDVVLSTIYAKTNESRGSVSAIIPNGSTYKFVMQAGSASKHWHELRA